MSHAPALLLLDLPDYAGRGAFLVDGRMVDLPFLKRAEALLASLDSNASDS
jgi:citrate lyase subunit beta/citryl-CoA lyase